MRCISVGNKLVSGMACYFAFLGYHVQAPMPIKIGLAIAMPLALVAAKSQAEDGNRQKWIKFLAIANGFSCFTEFGSRLENPSEEPKLPMDLIPRLEAITCLAAAIFSLLTIYSIQKAFKRLN